MSELPTSAHTGPTSEIRRCQRCGCAMAIDHHERTCSPCTRSLVLSAAGSHAARLPRGVRLDDVAGAWEHGLEAVARLAQIDRAQAAQLVWRSGLVDAPRSRLDEAAFLVLALETSTPHTEVARRLGVSRWTVASWRKALGPKLR